MTVTPEQFSRVAHLFPRQRGNAKHSPLEALNAILYVLENGCKWRALPERFGKWETIYSRMRTLVDQGILQKVLDLLNEEQVRPENVEDVQLDSTVIKAHPNAAGAPKKTGSKRSAAPVEG